MPSVTDTTVPSVRISAPVSSFWIRLLISSDISDGLSCMRIPWLLNLQCALERAELRAHGSVNNLVADHDTYAADQLLVQVHAGADLTACVLFEQLGKFRSLRGVELERRNNPGFDHAFALVLERLELDPDLGEQLKTVVLRQHAHQVFRLASQLSGQN